MDALVEIGNFATASAGDLWLLASNFLALIVLTGVLLVFAMKGGRGGLISLMLSLYAGYAIYIVFPYTDFVLTLGGTTTIKAALSILLFAAATIIPFLFLRRITSGGFGSLTFFQNLLLATIAAAFILALGYHLFDIGNIYTFPDPLNRLFEPKEYFFYWFIAPLAGLFFLAH